MLENRSKDSGILRVIGKGVCDHRERNSTIFINGACYHKEDVIVHENLHRLSNKPPENKVTFRIRKVNGKVREELRVMRVYKSGICESYFDEFGNFVKHKYLELKEGIGEVLTTYVMETAGSTATSAPCYNLGIIAAKELINIFGIEEIEEAHFRTDITKIKKIVDKRLGRGIFDKFSEALDNKETEFELVYEYLEKINNAFM